MQFISQAVCIFDSQYLMDETPFDSPTWYSAITLNERIELLRTFLTQPSTSEFNAELAGERMQEWRSQCPFFNNRDFAHRLAAEGLTEEEFLRVLGESVDDLSRRIATPPAWLTEVAEAFTNYAAESDLSPPVESMLSSIKSGLLCIIEPLICRALVRFQQRVQNIVKGRSDILFDPNTIAQKIFVGVPERLFAKLGPTMALELNVSRLEGELSGNTPEERYKSFVERIQRRDIAIAILQEYSVLTRQLVIDLDAWINFYSEFLQRLCDDCDVIRATLTSDADPGLLTEVIGGKGDAHRGGRSVLIARFSSGFQIVYKPRPMSVDVHFQELLGWINSLGYHPPYRTLKVIDRRSYGWVEFVTAEGCKSEEDVRRFYERQGGYLALLYTIEATDFHAENLIAAGEQPVLVDLESLFHPRVGKPNFREAESVADKTIAYSVLRVGLLPRRIWSSEDSDGIELSGLGFDEGQLSPVAAPYWEGYGTDRMHVEKKRMPLKGSQNQPSLDGNKINVLDYEEAIVSGFTCMYKLLVKYRDSLLSDNGPLSRFTNDEVRVILRPTVFYALLLRDSFHPDLLRDALDRDCLFERLWKANADLPFLAPILSAEREDLMNGDIPFFMTFLNSRDIWSSSNRHIPDFFDESSLSLVQHRILKLDEDDLNKQLWFIRASLASLSMNQDQTRWQGYRLQEPRSMAEPEQFLKAAQDIGDRLEAIALSGDQGTNWVGLEPLNERYWSLVPLRIDLYSGLPGIALFLAYLGAITQQYRYTNLAQTALATMRHQIARGHLKIGIGAFSGWSGVIHTLTHLAMLWDERSLTAEAENMVERIPPLIEQDRQFDIVNGSAGAIICLLNLYRASGSARALKVARQCGEWLVSHTQLTEPGVGWLTMRTATNPLLGLSHGAAGIAWSLLELGALTGESRFRAIALDAITYERTFFSPEENNWPDLREQGTQDKSDSSKYKYMTAWCHGAPGIGMARLSSLKYIDDQMIRDEINIALNTTIERGFGLNHSLCHGDLGNIELLSHASKIFGDQSWRVQLDRIGSAILKSIEDHGLLCGVPLGVETPGLMTGIAGIGYGLLRLAESSRVPSVLILDPPI